MRGWLRYTLIGVGSVVLVVAAIVAYVAATFDPNTYKPELIELVKAQKNRTLKLDGDIRLAFFPSIGAEVAKASLSERGSDREFAAIERAHISLKLMPLLSKQVVVDTIDVSGLRAAVVRYKDGRTSIDDLIGAEPQAGGKPASKPVPSEPGAAGGGFALDVDRVRVKDLAVTFRDEASGARYAVSKLDLETGRIANAVTTPVELSGRFEAAEPRLDVETRLKTRVTLDLPGKRYVLDGLDFSAKGAAFGIVNLVLAARGSVEAQPETNVFAAQGLALTLTGRRGADDLDIRLTMPRVRMTRDRVSGEKASVEAKIRQGADLLQVVLEIPGLEGTGKAFRASALTLDLDLKQGPNVVKGRIASPLSGSVEARRVELPTLAADLDVKNPSLPGGAVKLKLGGTAHVDGSRQTAGLDFDGRLDDAALRGRFAVRRFTPLSVAFDVNVDKLDIDRYLSPAKPGAKPPAQSTATASAPDAGKPAAGPPAAAAEKPLDFSALKTLDATGTVRIGALAVSNMKVQNLRADLRAAGGRLDVNPLAASLYQGAANGSLTLNAAGKVPQIAVKQTLAGVSVGPLIRDVAGKDMLEGRGSVALDVAMAGATVTAMKKAMNGTAAFNLADGAVKGINLGKVLRDARAALGAARGAKTQAASAVEKTDFSEMKATFVIRNGVARNDDLAIRSPLFRVGGAGDIDLGNETLDYTAKASIVGTSTGQGGKELSDLKGVTVPVRLSGSFAAPHYSVDVGTMLAESARGRLEETVKSRLGDRLPGGLKGLFGR